MNNVKAAVGGALVATLAISTLGLGTALWYVTSQTDQVAVSAPTSPQGVSSTDLKAAKPTKAEQALMRREVDGTDKIRVLRKESGEKVIAAWVPHYNIVALLGVTEDGRVVALDDFAEDQTGRQIENSWTKVELRIVIEAVAPDYYDPENESWDSITNPEGGDAYSSSDTVDAPVYSSSDAQ